MSVGLARGIGALDLRVIGNIVISWVVGCRQVAYWRRSFSSFSRGYSVSLGSGGRRPMLKASGRLGSANISMSSQSPHSANDGLECSTEPCWDLYYM